MNAHKDSAIWMGMLVEDVILQLQCQQIRRERMLAREGMLFGIVALAGLALAFCGCKVVIQWTAQSPMWLQVASFYAVPILITAMVIMFVRWRTRCTDQCR